MFDTSDKSVDQPLSFWNSGVFVPHFVKRGFIKGESHDLIEDSKKRIAVIFLIKRVDKRGS